MVTSTRTLGLGLLLACAGCATSGGLAPGAAPPKRLKVPETMRRPPDNSHGPPRTYVVRMSENGRTWELDLPEIAGGYVLRLPLASNASGTPPEVLTPVDEEILADALAGDAAGGSRPERASDKAAGESARGVITPADAASAGEKGEAASRPLPRKSYIATLARVHQLFAANRFELALLELAELEKAYPNDARLLSMKGSLYAKLGKTRLARETWTHALELRPDDVAVAEALRHLENPEEN